MHACHVHGGLFGRLEEELVAMRDAGIDYEIIPGVPSAFAAAAASASFCFCS